MSKNTSPSYLNNGSTPGIFSFQTVSRAKSSIEDTSSLSDWIGTQEFVSLQTQSYDQEGKSATLTFSLTGFAAEHFSLMRGLIALGQPLSFILQAVPKTRNFSLQFEVGQEQEVNSYLSRLFAIIESEIRFKQVLRKVIANQERFEREERLLFNNL